MSWLGQWPAGVSLLEEGLAKLHASFDSARTPGGRELAGAQEKARGAKLRVWEKDTGAAEAAAAAAEADVGSAERERVEVTVTDVRDSNAFYVQMAGEPRVGWITEQIAGLGLDEAAAGGLRLGPGDRCLARFSLDGQVRSLCWGGKWAGQVCGLLFCVACRTCWLSPSTGSTALRRAVLPRCRGEGRHR